MTSAARAAVWSEDAPVDLEAALARGELPDAAPFLVRTSGSTGAATALIRTRESWQRCFEAEAALLGLTSGDRFLALGRPAFSLTPYVALRAAHLGACFGGLDTVRPGAARAALRDLVPTVVYGVPPLVLALARASGGLGRESVRLVVTGGARLTPGQAAAIRAAWPGARLVTFYGAAETSFIAMNTAPDPEDPEDVGPLFPGVAGARDAEGRLRVRTPYAASWRLDADGGRVPVADSDGWVTLADRGTVDAAGRVSLQDRADACLNLGGALVDPAPLERALERLPWVAEAVLLARPDAARSDSAVAVVVPLDRAPAGALFQLRAALPGEGPPVRGWAVLCEAPPRTAGGKPDRAALGRALAAGTLTLEPL